MPGQGTAVLARSTFAGARTPRLLSRRSVRRSMDWKERKAAYYAKLKDPRWQQKRLRIFERDGWACQICGGKDGTLHVHHIAYAPNGSEPWDDPDALLLTACESCHEREHGLHREMVYTLLWILSDAGVRSARDLFGIIERVAYVANDPESKDKPRALLTAVALGMAIQEWPQEKEKQIRDGTYFKEQ